jgi:hypothetical protein
MNRIKDYAGFVGWFAGLGYIVLWPVTSPELGGKPFGASIFCRDASPSALDFLCNSANLVHLSPGLHAIGFLSAVFVTTRLLGYAVKRSRHAGRPALAHFEGSGPLAKFMLSRPAKQKYRPPLRRVKPRKEFGLRGMSHDLPHDLPH